MREKFDALVEARRQWLTHDIGEPDAMSAAVSIVRANQLVNASVEHVLRPLDLTFARYEILMLLLFSRNGALPMTKIGERLLVHPTGITKLVHKLEERGLVSRRPNASDGRSTLAAITPAGRRLARRGSEAVTSVRFGVELGSRETKQLVNLLTELRRASGDL